MKWYYWAFAAIIPIAVYVWMGLFKCEYITTTLISGKWKLRQFSVAHTGAATACCASGAIMTVPEGIIGIAVCAVCLLIGCAVGVVWASYRLQKIDGESRDAIALFGNGPKPSSDLNDPLCVVPGLSSVRVRPLPWWLDLIIMYGCMGIGIVVSVLFVALGH